MAAERGCANRCEAIHLLNTTAAAIEAVLAHDLPPVLTSFAPHRLAKHRWTLSRSAVAAFILDLTTTSSYGSEHMSANTKSLAKLTSLSTQTLSLLLERERLQPLPSTSSTLSPGSQPLKGPHATQITRNLRQLRAGILEMEEKEGRSEAVMLLRNQYERMGAMLGNEAGGIEVESLDPPAPTQPSPSSSSTDSLPRAPSPPMVLPPTPPSKTSEEFSYTPYKDDPEAQPPLGDADIMLQQRLMMNEQDEHLDRLSHSINRQHHISLQIGDELDVHTGLLEELDTGIDRTHSRLRGARRGLDRVARGAKENSSAVAIGLIIFILLILIVVFKT